MIKMEKKRKWYKIEAREKNVKLAVRKTEFFFQSNSALMKTGLFPLQILHISCIMPEMPLGR